MMKAGGREPSFSYHSTPRQSSGGPQPVSRSPPIASMSPSPSTSAAATPHAPTQNLEITRLVQGSEGPRFSYQAMPSSLKLAEATSTSPSPSKSAHATVMGPMAPASMTCLIQTRGEPPLFSYQATVSIEYSAVTTSRSPSRSTSAATTPAAWVALAEITLLVKTTASARAVTTVLEATSRSASPAPLLEEWAGVMRGAPRNRRGPVVRNLGMVARANRSGSTLIR